MAKNEPNKPEEVKTAPAQETTTEEKSTLAPMPEISGEAPAPEKTAEETAALPHEDGAALHESDKNRPEVPTSIDIPAPGDVVVSFDKINEIVSGKQAAVKEAEQTAPEKQEVEKSAPTEKTAKPEKTSPNKKNDSKSKTAEKADKKPSRPAKQEKAPKAVKPEKPDNPKNPEKPSVPSNPSTPQKPVPQTGDDPYIFLYGGLLAAALIGGSVFAVYYFKKGKYSRTSPKRTAVGASVLSLCALVALGSGFLVFRDLNQYAESKDAYRDLAGYVEVPEQTASPEQATDPTETKQDDADIVLPSVDFEALRENGPDIIGWLSLPDTVINYPVTQTDNNEYYLNHLYDGTYNKVGCLFADYENRADFSDRNTIVYGHNMRDGSMFALLNRYDEQSYFDTHRQMYLVTPKGGYVMEIFAAFAAKPEESGSETSPWQLSWKDDGAYTTWLTAMKERSAVESDVTVTCSDKVLTLSTCTPGGTGRFLVMGKLVKVDNEI